MEAARLAQLESALRFLALSAVSYSGTVFRILIPKYANRQESLSGSGSNHASGRFHVQGAFQIVYTGCTHAQAKWEIANVARKSVLPLDDMLPLTSLSANVQLSKVLDLTDRHVRARLKVTKYAITQDAWNTTGSETVTQAIGRLAYQHGFEAILAPTAGPANNLNLLPENYLPGSFVRIINEDRLPPPPNP